MKRFWIKVDRSGDCWVWCAARQKSGYGKFYFEGRLDGAHRVAWILTRGSIGADQHVCHKCDNPWCVNPDHLFLGDRSDNMQDCANKGRNGSQVHPESRPRGAQHFSKTQPSKVLRGERNGRHKLTVADVIEARRRHASGETAKALAGFFGVSPTTMQKCVNRELWRCVP